jgi:glutaredoxin
MRAAATAGFGVVIGRTDSVVVARRRSGRNGRRDGCEGHQQQQQYVWDRRRGMNLIRTTATTDDGIEKPKPRPPVVVVGTSSCPHCVRAKKALDDAGFDYEEIRVDDAPALRASSSALAGFRSVPQVYVGGEIHGGADDTCAGIASGVFGEKYAAARANGAEGAPRALREALERYEAGTLEMPEEAVKPASSSWLTDLMASGKKKEAAASAVDVAREMSDAKTGVARRARRRFAGLTDGIFGAFKTYQGTFTAKEAVDWMVKNGKASDASVATEIGAEMVRERLIVDVDATHPFVVVEDEAKAPLFRFQSEAPALGCAPLNAAKLFTGEPRDAKTVVEDVRRRILKLYDAFLSSDGRAVDYDGVAASDDFKDFVQASEELQRVNLNALTREERMAFFINVYNALVIHGTCVFGTPKNTLERLDFFSKVSYNIDGHNYTCDDIENGVLRGNRPGAASIGALLGKMSLSRGPFREKDPRRSNVVLPMDPRVHFALVCGARSCPPIRVYTAENIDSELEDAAYSFFESEIDVTVGENGVASSAAVSKIVGEWYKFDFGADDAERLRYASEYMREGAERDALRKALDDANATVSLTTRAYDWTLNDDK